MVQQGPGCLHSMWPMSPSSTVCSACGTQSLRNWTAPIYKVQIYPASRLTEPTTSLLVHCCQISLFAEMITKYFCSQANKEGFCIKLQHEIKGKPPKAL